MANGATILGKMNCTIVLIYVYLSNTYIDSDRYISSSEVANVKNLASRDALLIYEISSRPSALSPKS